MVEVRGIEPRSVDASVAASPSAANGELSEGRTPSASDRPPNPESISIPRSGNPGGSILLNDARAEVAGPLGRTGCLLLRQPVQDWAWHLWLLPVFYETPVISARFRHLSHQRRNLFTPIRVFIHVTTPL